MDDMQFAKYAADIREILEKTDQESLENLVRNAVAYSQSNNNNKVNWIAHVGLCEITDRGLKQQNLLMQKLLQEKEKINNEP